MHEYLTSNQSCIKFTHTQVELGYLQHLSRVVYCGKSNGIKKEFSSNLKNPFLLYFVIIYIFTIPEWLLYVIHGSTAFKHAVMIIRQRIICIKIIYISCSVIFFDCMLKNCTCETLGNGVYNLPSTTDMKIIITFEHLLERISLTFHQSYRFTIIDMKINRQIKFNMIKTQ